MAALKFLLDVFLYPGTLVLRKCGVNIEEDGGVFRSFINMCVWTAVAMGIMLTFF